MTSVNDWASRAASRIDDEYITAKHRPSLERVAAIIATFAGSILNLLNESRKTHHHDPVDNYEHDRDCCPRCTCDSWDAVARAQDGGEMDAEHEPNSDKPCDCGADEWNKKIDEALR